MGQTSPKLITIHKAFWTAFYLTASTFAVLAVLLVHGELGPDTTRVGLLLAPWAVAGSVLLGVETAKRPGRWAGAR